MKVPIRALRFLTGAVLVIGICATQAQAQVTTIQAGSGSLSASAKFDLSGTTLTVTLTNTSQSDVLVPTDVLTGLLFNVNSGTLTPTSANLNGSTAFYAPIVNNVGEGWVYNTGISAHGENSGISAAGLGVFGNTPTFFVPGVSPINGINYGILSAGDNTATGNTGVTGAGPLIKNSVQFVLTTSAGFALTNLDLTSAVFQYGTALTEPSIRVPEPSVIACAGTVTLFGLGLAWRRRKGRTA